MDREIKMLEDSVVNKHYEGISQSVRLFLKFLWKYFVLILEHTTVHGGQHLVANISSETKKINRRHPIEIWIWIVIITAASVCCTLTGMQFIRRYFDNPTVLSIEKDFVNWNTTFPSLTICNENRINDTALELYLRQQPASVNRTFLEQFLRSLANFDINFSDTNELLDYDGINSKDYLSILFNLSNRYDYDVDTGAKYRWPLQETITEHGICLSFNSEIARYLSPEYIFRNRLPKSIEPYVVNYFDDRKFGLLNKLYSTNLFLHGPYDLPKPSTLIQLKENPSKYTALYFEALSVLAKDAVKYLYVSQRKCRFIDESELPHFPAVYSQSICMAECKIQSMISWCGCVPWFYKALPGERHCNTVGLKCISFYKHKIKSDVDKCKCENNCITTRFNLKQISSVTWFRGTTLRWELTDPRFRLIQEIIFSETDVLVAVGSTCGLFLGLSVLSLVETFYFYVIHFIFTLKRRMSHRQV